MKRLILLCESCGEEITKDNMWSHGIVNGKKTKHYYSAYIFEDELTEKERKKFER